VDILSGHAFIFGDDIDIDEILPRRYLNTVSPSEYPAHCMEDVDPDFARRVKPGDIIVAGKNFGVGTGRGQAATALKGCGLSCIIAKNFGRIFFRNTINMGLPAIECPEAFGAVNQGDVLEIQMKKHCIVNKTKSEVYQFEAFPPMITTLLESGGLMEAIKQGKLK